VGRHVDPTVQQSLWLALLLDSIAHGAGTTTRPTPAGERGIVCQPWKSAALMPSGCPAGH
jgi:hypothetical protein